jgi:hypothetical protein
MMSITSLHMTRTHDFMAAIKATCGARRLPMPDIRDVRVTERNSRVYSFAIFPQPFGYKLEAYKDSRFLDQISSSLNGLPVTYSNSTGFRLVAVIEGTRDQMPTMVNCPAHLLGQVRLGVDEANRELALGWERFGHGLIVGMTGSGKSSLLRVIVSAAIQDNLSSILCDLHDNTFPMLAGHHSILAPIAHTVPEYIERMRLIRELIEQRRAQYQALHARGIFPDTLDEYNAAVEPNHQSKRVVAFFDEFSSACDQDGGKNGELAHLAFQNVVEARKFGIMLIFSGQSISADLVGPMRDQLTTRICFRVARRDISRIAIFRSGAESLRHAGRAMTLDGVLQAYYCDKQRLIDLARGTRCTSTPESPVVESVISNPAVTLAQRAPALVPDEIRLVEAAQAADGWFKINDIAAATGLGRDWINDVARKWAVCGYVTPVLYEGKQRLGRRITDKLLEAARLRNSPRLGVG